MIERAFGDCDNCIFFCTDQGFVAITSVAIQSIIIHAKSQEKYDILVFHSGINVSAIQTLESMAAGYQNISVRAIDISNVLRGRKFYTANRKTITVETYYRLFAPFVLDPGYKKALYLDGDMVVTDDIQELLQTDIEQYYIAGVRDYWGICNCYIPGDSRRAYRESIGIEKIDEYIIGATVLFNLNQFRNRFTLDGILDLACSRDWEQHDQDVINIICKDHILFISPKWGMMRDYGNNHYLPHELQAELDIVTKPTIIHYGAYRKPWKHTYMPENEIFWRIAEQSPYFEEMLALVRNVDYRIFILKKLANGTLSRTVSRTVDGGKTLYHYKGIPAGDVNTGAIEINKIRLDGEKLVVEGTVSVFPIELDTPLDVYFIHNGEQRMVQKQWDNDRYLPSLKETVYRSKYFVAEISLEEQEESIIGIIAETRDGVAEQLPIRFGSHCALGNELDNQFLYKDGWCVTVEENRIAVAQRDKRWVVGRELKLYKELYKVNRAGMRKAIVARAIARVLKPFVRRPIWLVSDSLQRADDNGEAFFRFLQTQKKYVNSYFVISRDSDDFERIKKYGKVIPACSYCHKIIQLLTTCVISSQTDEAFRNPFYRHFHLYRDLLFRAKYIYLQHGVITDSYVNWLNRNKQGFDGFITTTNREYDRIIHGGYGYDREVWQTGLARFDLLENQSAKLITFVPTWRKYLSTYQDPETGICELKAGFEKTGYATFYREILGSKRLIEACRQYGYTLQFKLHPSFMGKEKAFGFDEHVRVVDGKTSYRTIYSESALLITDYSSSIGDFVYLRKPVIYCQFDKKDFFSGKHVNDGIETDYEQEGYGEVEYTLESTIDRIITYMRDGCQLKETYRQRIDADFPHPDKNNCERIYQRILALL